MSALSPWGKHWIADETDPAAMDYVTDKLATAADPVSVPTFTSTAARDAAAAPLIAADSNVRLLAVVDGIGLSRYLGPKIGGGQDWEWVGNVTPRVYTFALGLGPVWSLTTVPAGAAGPGWNAAWTFTPTRTGWANIHIAYDALKSAAAGIGSFVAAYIRPKFNPGGGATTVLLGDRTILYDHEPRRTDEFHIPYRVRLTEGQPATLSLDVSVFKETVGANQWQFGSFTWTAVQQ